MTVLTGKTGDLGAGGVGGRGGGGGNTGGQEDSEGHSDTEHLQVTIVHHSTTGQIGTEQYCGYDRVVRLHCSPHHTLNW